VLQSIQHVKPVVIVDEAHLLDRETMEELRFFLNFKIDSDSPMALIFVGQPELSDKLRRQAYLAIEQRVNLKCYNP
jgi:type II secretory pathway predicted ATPase ExeA